MIIYISFVANAGYIAQTKDFTELHAQTEQMDIEFLMKVKLAHKNSTFIRYCKNVMKVSSTSCALCVKLRSVEEF